MSVIPVPWSQKRILEKTSDVVPKIKKYHMFFISDKKWFQEHPFYYDFVIDHSFFAVSDLDEIVRIKLIYEINAFDYCVDKEDFLYKIICLNTNYLHRMNNPPEKVQRRAVFSKPNLIRFIKNPSEEVQNIAVRANPKLIEYIKNPSEQTQKTAIQIQAEVIKFIHDPSPRVQLFALRKNRQALEWIKNPHKTALSYCSIYDRQMGKNK